MGVGALIDKKNAYIYGIILGAGWLILSAIANGVDGKDAQKKEFVQLKAVVDATFMGVMVFSGLLLAGSLVTRLSQEESLTGVTRGVSNALRSSLSSGQ